MRTLFIAAILLLTAQAVPALATDGHNAEREARFNAWCQANADQCRDVLAWRQQCQADPEKCRAEVEARVTARFRQADANGDGGLSREEAQKAMPRAARHFDQIDANRDGIVTLEELQAVRRARFESRRGSAI